jgi:hypothetical protein
MFIHAWLFPVEDITAAVPICNTDLALDMAIEGVVD